MTEKLKAWIEGERELFDFEAAPAKKTGKVPSLHGDNDKAIEVFSKAVSVIAAAAVLTVLLAVVYTMPLFGSGSETDNELSQRYVEQGMYEIGAQNLVANMILVYRGFDTFGESTVLFTAATCVIFLLLGFDADQKENGSEKNTTILRVVVTGLFPFVLVFAVYILLNGHLSPGGGFSGGAILGAGMILLDVSLGQRTVNSFFNHSVYNFIKVTALCVYGLIILYLVYCGANGIPNGISIGTAGSIFSAGVILPINIMVGFEVACTMYAFFTYFYRGELK